MKTRKTTLCAVLVVSAGLAYAAPIVTVPEGGTDGEWASDTGAFTVEGAAQTLDGLSATQINYDGSLGGVPTAIISSTYDDATGNWSSLQGQVVHSISFNFYMEENPDPSYNPPGLSVYISGDGGNASWFYDVSNFQPVTEGWNAFSVSLQDAGWWNLGGGGNFQSDLTDVSAFGVELSLHPDDASISQLYGLNDFTLNYAIPEPHEWAMIIFAMLALCTLYRRELQARLDAALAKVRS